jgi:flagellar biosynthesis/type III secretory pathway protein FliH
VRFDDKETLAIACQDVGHDLANGCPSNSLQERAFYMENVAPQDVPETIDVLIDILKEEVPEVSERFTEWLASYLAGQGLDVTADQPIRDLQEVRAMFATKFQEYSRRLKEEGLEQGREEGLSEGLDEGRTAERLAIARRLLERGETVEQVAELTGLSPDDVADLAKER